MVPLAGPQEKQPDHDGYPEHDNSVTDFKLEI